MFSSTKDDWTEQVQNCVRKEIVKLNPTPADDADTGTDEAVSLADESAAISAEFMS